MLRSRFLLPLDCFVIVLRCSLLLHLLLHYDLGRLALLAYVLAAGVIVDDEQAEQRGREEDGRAHAPNGA